MAKNKRKASAKPSKLAIARSGNKFTFSWALPKGGYNSQKLQYRLYTNGKAGKWVTKNPGKTAKSFAYSYTVSAYYPYSNKPRLTEVEFRVGGTAASTNKITYTWSGYVAKALTLAAPNVPSITQTVDTEIQGKCSFATSTSVSDTDAKPYVNGLFQTILVKDSDVDSGADAFNQSDAIINRGSWTAGSSYTYARQEDLLELSSGSSYVRWVRMQSRGAAGWSSWAYQHHSYALPLRAVITEKEVQEKEAGGYTCYFAWKVQSTFSRPIDRVVPQYCFAVPDAGMQCPDGASWTSLAPVTLTGTSDATRFSIDRALAGDQCLFVRANTEHDKIGEDNGVTRGAPAVAATGYLKDPGTPSYVLGDNYALTVTATNISEVEDSIVAIYYTDSTNPEDPIIVGYIPHGSSSVSVQCPEFSANPSIGVRAIVPNGTPVYTTDAAGVRHYTIDSLMESENIVYPAGVTIPVAPSNVEVAQSATVTNTVRVTWEWSWEAATGVELSWADHPDAWESTDEPSTYDVSAIRASAWNISGLDAGVTWYIRVRFMKEDGDTTTYSPYSAIKSITPKSSPSIPSLELSDSVITPDGSVTASWGYTTTDGTGQGYAEVTTAVINASGLYYGKYALSTDTEVVSGKAYFELVGGEYTLVTPVGAEDPSDEGWYEVVDNIIAHTETAQHVTITASDPLINWQAGETYMLCVRVMSQSGAQSEGWSAPQSVTIAEPLECTITQTSLVEGTITSQDGEGQTVTETVASLTVLTDETPFTITVTGAGDYGTTLIAIERAADIVIERPDGINHYGYEGETVALIESPGEGQVSVTRQDLIGTLDDGGVYRIVATVMDSLGQSATTSAFSVNGNEYNAFSVIWAHQALIPSATAVIDTDYNIAKITPSAPEGTLEGDTFDIYRLSVDKPELVVEGGTWGTTYVDPYPTIGDYGGHRVVFRTFNGDYTTASSEPAWIDLAEDEGDVLDLDYSIIDYGGSELEVRYNMELSSSFGKSFEETTYLGGAVKGDWNAAVTRSGSIKAVCEVAADPEVVEKVRQLATYAGICHVRSKDGSSYAADVQVSDEQSYDTAGKVFKFSMSVTKVDPEGLDGMTLAEWEAQQE